jgi:hypothetical protein
VFIGLDCFFLAIAFLKPLTETLMELAAQVMFPQSFIRRCISDKLYSLGGFGDNINLTRLILPLPHFLLLSSQFLIRHASNETLWPSFDRGIAYDSVSDVLA